MKTKRVKSFFMTAVLLLNLLAANLYAQNHPVENKLNKKITDVTILKQLLNEPGISNKEVRIEVVDFPPGSVSPAHRHPCPTFGYILEGEIESVFEGKRHLYKQGDAFYEKPYGLHAVTRNYSKTKTARLLVFFINAPARGNSIPVK